MLFIIIIVLIVMLIILSILKKKNVITLKFLNEKILIVILLIILLILGGFRIFFKRQDIVFFFQSLEYANIDKYDYSNDIADSGHISKEGAIKIAKEATKEKRVAKVNCELIENGAYIDYDETFRKLSEKKIFDTSNSVKKATFWAITLTTGWDYACGHEEEWRLKIDYYTGEVLQKDVTE